MISAYQMFQLRMPLTWQGCFHSHHWGLMVKTQGMLYQTNHLGWNHLRLGQTHQDQPWLHYLWSRLRNIYDKMAVWVTCVPEEKWEKEVHLLNMHSQSPPRRMESPPLLILARPLENPPDRIRFHHIVHLPEFDQTHIIDMIKTRSFFLKIGVKWPRKM